ncbi:MAG TPA: hypothetical protein VN901_02770 [Candidatus Acidoferrales bacterium]|nr:hypothetical protein [Candidatus Acidoferrales bacterium]
MFRISKSTLLNSIPITLLVAALTAAQALTPAGAKRPATVPADYVITPFGYFHPSCVGHLAKGDVVRQDEKVIEHANGASDDMHVCAYPHYKGDGAKVTGDEKAADQPTISHAWVEYAGTTTTSSYAYMYAYWNVPPAPSTNDGQTVYLFNGLEDYSDVVTIIQPVLGWNSDYASAWGIASWNCCVTGTAYEATPKPVNSGDLILGVLIDTCAPGTKSCASWDIFTLDVTTGAESELLNTSSFGQTFNWAFGGVLEVYNIAQCGDYPANGSINFYDQGLYNDKFVRIASPGWKVANLSSGLTPQCGYGGELPREVILNY